MELHEMRQRQNESLTMSLACYTICMLTSLVAALTVRFTKTRNTTRLKCCACHAKWRWQSPKWHAATKNATCLSKPCKSIAPATQKDFRHVMKQVGMSQSATPATRNEAMSHLKTPKVTTFAELASGTVILHDGRGRLRTQKQRRANTSQPPDPQSKTSTLRYVFEEKKAERNIIPKTI